MNIIADVIHREQWVLLSSQYFPLLTVIGFVESLKEVNSKEYNDIYFKSIVGVAKRLYHHMKERSKNKGWNFEFSYDEFAEWLDKTPFEKLYDAWVDSGYSIHIKPSIDRIDEDGIYEFSNMRVITWIDNWKLGQSGKKNVGAYNKTFSEYRESRQYDFIVVDEDDNVVGVYNNQNQTARDLNLQVSKINCCLLNNRVRHKNLYFYPVCEVIAR